MRIATWNINSVRTRAQRAVDLAQRHDLDVICLQETKVQDSKFPREIFEAAGYHVACHGLNQWNGVAIISKDQPEDVRTHFPHQPGFHKDPDKPQDREARAIGATINGVEIWSLYIPNGRELGDPHYAYKLAFFYALARYAEQQRHQKLLLTGDFNIVPEDKDVWDIEAFRGKTHVSEPERAAFQMLLESGLTPLKHEQPYTYFDYKASRFQRGQGMKIDFMLASAPLLSVLGSAPATFVDMEERAGEKTSDHVPLVTQLDLLDFSAVR